MMVNVIILTLFGLVQAHVIPNILEPAKAYYDDMDEILNISSGDFMTTNPDWLFEGDIIPIDASRKVSTSATLWPNGEVFYKLHSSLPQEHLVAIAESIDHWEANTCLTFSNETGNVQMTSGFILFTNENAGCYSYVGKVNFADGQPLNLGSGCQYPKIAIHEIGHAIGFSHEQSRMGRDDYVTILWDNIRPGKENNFQARSTHNYGVGYDYQSIMHYRQSSFQTDRSKKTIRTVDPRFQNVIGTNSVLSFRDLKTAHMAYCADRYAATCSLPSADICNSGYLGANCNCVCPLGTTGNNCESGSEILINICGETITSEGTYQTPNYPSRSLIWEERSCVYIIQAPRADQNVIVEFEDFSFHQFSNISGELVCYYDEVEIRLDGSNSDGEIKCGEQMRGSIVRSTGDEMVILINSRYHARRGMKFNVGFSTETTTNSATSTTTTVPTTNTTIAPTTTAPTTTTTAPTTTTIAPTTTTTAPTTTTTAPTTTTTAPTTTTTAPTTTTTAPTTTTTAPTTTTTAPTTTTTAPTTTATAPTTTTTAPTTTTTAPTTTTTAPTTTTTAPTTTTPTAPTTTTTPTDGFVTCDIKKTVHSLATGESIEIRSLNYPSNYPNNHRCVVVVETADSSDKLMFEVVDFELENGPQCDYDFVKLKNVFSGQTLLYSCGSQSPCVRTFAASKIKFVFRTDYSVTRSGFIVKFTAVSA